MGKTNEAKSKKGFFGILKESMTKTSEGCGPGCGCHVDERKDAAKSGEETKGSQER